MYIVNMPEGNYKVINKDTNGNLVLESGNLGFGTSNPLTELHINNAANPKIRLSDNQSRWATGYLQFCMNGPATEYGQGQYTDVQIVGNENGIDFQSQKNNETSVNMLKVAANGNVGIGTTNPGYKLDITGNFNCSSDLNVGGSSSSSRINIGGWYITGASVNGTWALIFSHGQRYNVAHLWYWDNNNTLDFTGSHRCSCEQEIYNEKYIGLLVISTGSYSTYDNEELNIGKEGIKIDDALPVVGLACGDKLKNIFGVISAKEKSKQNERGTGMGMVKMGKYEYGDIRLKINGIGEGGIWVCNKNGQFENGDYITSSSVSGYGMKQDDDILHNYTCAKITCDCSFKKKQKKKMIIKKEMGLVSKYQNKYDEIDIINFDRYNNMDDKNKDLYTEIKVNEMVNVLDEHGSIQWIQTDEYEDEYQYRYLLSDGTQISEEDYITKKSNGEDVYMACFVGCTYHCG